MAFLSKQELKKIGLKNFGENVLVSNKASFYNPHEISIGSNVRIDDFSILSGKIELGNHIHISAYCALYGKFGIKMEDYTGLSPQCLIFSASDDFSGRYMISPMVPEKYTNVSGGKVSIKRFAQIGAGSIVFPNITISEGSAIGAMSLINRDTEPWTINAGCPSKKIRNRERIILNLYDSL